MTFVYRRTMADVEKALKALSSYFKEDFFVLVGSQASLISWNSTPDEMRNTPEIDVYLQRFVGGSRKIRAAKPILRLRETSVRALIFIRRSVFMSMGYRQRRQRYQKAGRQGLLIMKSLLKGVRSPPLRHVLKTSSYRKCVASLKKIRSTLWRVHEREDWTCRQLSLALRQLRFRTGNDGELKSG